MPTDDLVIRQAGSVDLPGVAEVHLAAREASIPEMPPLVHSPDEVRAFHAALDLTDREALVAETDRVIGYVEVKRDWLDDLYVHPAHQARGVGSALLDLAKTQRPNGFCLWVFESNRSARDFYLRRGLLELETTDGSSNEERAADVRMVWPGREPLSFLRHLIDDVDDQLGELLSRRLALTRTVQAHKPDRSRDAERERDIVRRLASRTPELGEERLARIMHAIITESLDATS